MYGNMDKEAVRKTLRDSGATLVREEHRQERTVLDLPIPSINGWLRVRKDSERTTLSYKEAGTKLEEQKEIEVVVDSYEKACSLALAIGCKVRSVQETLREKWMLGVAEVTIDTWPYLEPIVEIEGPSEDAIKEASLRLGFDYTKGIFGTVNHLYKAKYGKYIEDIPGDMVTLTFSAPNPFL